MAKNYTSGTSQRYHSLDALKASMMSLGLVLHAAINYAIAPPETWGIRDPQKHLIFDLLYYYIHLFRMPVFFLIAGFFAALLYEKRGLGSLLLNRMQRVLLPLILFGTILLPVNAFCFVFAAHGGGEKGWETAWEYVTSGHFLDDVHLAHLWFLYYLLYLYAAALLIIWLTNTIPLSLRQQAKTLTSNLLLSKGGIWSFIILTFLTLLPMSGAGLDTSTYLVPVPRILLAYAVFFSYGWLLYLQKDIINIYSLGWKKNCLLGFIFSLVYLFLLIHPQGIPEYYASLLTKAIAAMAIWYLSYASIGIFLRFANKPSPLGRYLSDASYWMYIVHLPFLALLVGWLGQTAISAFVKFFIVLFITLFTTVFTYHYLVRATFIGALLNGRRYPRALPKAPTAAESKPIHTL